ncbi:MAG: hypothetical protein M3R25_02970 [Bacteroidota bacterium]|nr:hypothetical protein [Bacteroidota bacterium]
MRINNKLNQLFAILFCCSTILIFSQCKKPVEEKVISPLSINTEHLDALYQEIEVEGDSVGIIHIYSEYPDYKWKGDDDEGIACVDDASRAAIFYMRQYQLSHDPEHLRKGKMLMRFLLAMQAPNGYYYNFIWPDGKTHKDGITSTPDPNFWAWRTLWAFGEAVQVMDADDVLSKAIREQRQHLVRNILTHADFRKTELDTTMGINFPTWLPKISGTDQAAIILSGLTLMLQQASPDEFFPKDSVLSFMDHFAEGIMMMQIEEPDSLQDGAFLSWENLWHAYANIQSYALLMTGDELMDPHMISHAMYEIDHFYPTVLKTGGLEHFQVRTTEEKTIRYETSNYSQIAYGRRPMIWAAVEAYKITKEERYLSLAKDLTAWFSGDNPAKLAMYDPATGRCFDGIISPTEINKNSGAESTIEALLSLQALERVRA